MFGSLRKRSHRRQTVDGVEERFAGVRLGFRFSTETDGRE